MKPAAVATSTPGEETDPPPSTISLTEPRKNPETPTTPVTAATLAQELQVAVEHLKTVNAKLFELVQVEEKEKNLLSVEVNSLRAEREKKKHYMISVENELAKLHKYMGDRNKEFYPEEYKKE